MRPRTYLTTLACGLMLALTSAAEAQTQLSIGNPNTGQALTFGRSSTGNLFVTPGYGNTNYANPYGATPYNPYGATPYNPYGATTYNPYGTSTYNNYGTTTYNPYGTGSPAYGSGTTRYYSSGYSGYTNPTTPGYGYSNSYSNQYRPSYRTVTPYRGYSPYAPYGYNYGGRR